MALTQETLRRLEGLGFEDWMMGGGCHAYGRNLAAGGYELIADQGGADLPKDEAAPCNIARYSDEPDYQEDGLVSLDGWLSLTALLEDLEKANG